MLLRFMIDPLVFGDLVQRGVWDIFLGSLELFWPAHGVFLMPEDFDDILDRSGLDSHRVSQWRKFSMTGGKRTAPHKTGNIDWAGIQSWQDLKEHNGKFELGILQQAQTIQFRSTSDSEYCAHDPSGQITIELACGDHLLFTCQSRNAQALGRKSVTQTETPTQIWEERFRDYVRHSTSILLVDIYAARRWDGLRCFLEKLVTDGRQPGETVQTLHVYSSYGTFNGTGDRTASYIKRQLEEGIKDLSAGFGPSMPNLKVQVHLLHQNEFPNDRWLRVDDNIIELGHGLEILESTRSQGFSCNLSDADSGRQSQEIGLYSVCKNHRDDSAFLYGPFSFSVCTRPPKTHR